MTTKINIQSFLSGFLGASASCIGKLGLDSSSPIPSYALQFCTSYIIHSNNHDDDDENHFCFATTIGVRIICLLLMIGLNAFMIHLFLDGMNESGSVVASAISTAANFTISALYGILLFHESVNTTWMIGFAFILTGVWLLSTVNLKTNDDDNEEMKKKQ